LFFILRPSENGVPAEIFRDYWSNVQLDKYKFAFVTKWWYDGKGRQIYRIVHP